MTSPLFNPNPLFILSIHIDLNQMMSIINRECLGCLKNYQRNQLTPRTFFCRRELRLNSLSKSCVVMTLIVLRCLDCVLFFQAVQFTIMCSSVVQCFSDFLFDFV